ncbi:MAG: Inner rane component of cytoplasmic domain [Verrucomicrobiota bacterium]
MVQFKILSGTKAGTTWVARRFPVRIGRSATDDLQLQEQGIWDEHLRMDFQPGAGFILKALPDAPATVNGQAVQQAKLRNGDLIEIGSLKMQFSLSETRQSGLRLREWLTWSAFAAISLGQVALIYWLLG